MTTSKLFKLTLVATALLLIPKRSSRNADCSPKPPQQPQSTQKAKNKNVT
ncbi:MULTISPECIES: hypothetical protein [unclassified Moraxella]